MIPKVIHYCWFGGKSLDGTTVKNIETWHKLMPDYEIKRWDESNFSFSACEFARKAYENKKWAFLSDFARLVVVSEYGGLYFDTDVEIVKSFDDLLKYDAFYGFENNENINTGEGFGAIKGHSTVLSMLTQYLKLLPDSEENYPLIPCPALNTKALLPMGLKLSGERQNVAGAEILPKDYFNPYDDPTGRLKKTQNTYSIHWYSKSWLSKGTILKSKLTKPLHRIFGTDIFAILRGKK